MLRTIPLLILSTHAWQDSDLTRRFDGDFVGARMYDATACLLLGNAQDGPWDVADGSGDVCMELDELEIDATDIVRFDTPELNINHGPSNSVDGQFTLGVGSSTSTVFADQVTGVGQGLRFAPGVDHATWILIVAGANRFQAYTKPTPTANGVPFVINDSSTSANRMWLEHTGTEARIHSDVGALYFESNLAWKDGEIHTPGEDCPYSFDPVSDKRSLYLVEPVNDCTYLIRNSGVTDGSLVRIINMSAGFAIQFDDDGGTTASRGSGPFLEQYDSAEFVFKSATGLWHQTMGSDN